MCVCVCIAYTYTPAVMPPPKDLLQKDHSPKGPFSILRVCLMFGLRSLALSVLTVSAVVVTVVTVVVAMSLGEYLHVLLYLPLAQLRPPRPLFRPLRPGENPAPSVRMYLCF